MTTYYDSIEIKAHESAQLVKFTKIDTTTSQRYAWPFRIHRFAGTRPRSLVHFGRSTPQSCLFLSSLSIHHLSFPEHSRTSLAGRRKRGRRIALRMACTSLAPHNGRKWLGRCHFHASYTSEHLSSHHLSFETVRKL